MNRTLSVKIDIKDFDNYLFFMKQCSEIFNKHIEWAFSNKSYRKDTSP